MPSHPHAGVHADGVSPITDGGLPGWDTSPSRRGTHGGLRDLRILGEERGEPAWPLTLRGDLVKEILEDGQDAERPVVRHLHRVTPASILVGYLRLEAKFPVPEAPCWAHVFLTPFRARSHDMSTSPDTPKRLAMFCLTDVGLPRNRLSSMPNVIGSVTIRQGGRSCSEPYFSQKCSMTGS